MPDPRLANPKAGIPLTNLRYFYTAIQGCYEILAVPSRTVYKSCRPLRPARRQLLGRIRILVYFASGRISYSDAFLLLSVAVSIFYTQTFPPRSAKI